MLLIGELVIFRQSCRLLSEGILPQREEGGKRRGGEKMKPFSSFLDTNFLQEHENALFRTTEKAPPKSAGHERGR